MTGQITGQITPQQLTEARLQLHYAVQFIAVTGAALVEPLPDDSHTSLTWNPALEMFVGAVIRSRQPFQVALDPVRLTLILLNKQSQQIASFPLHGKTMTEGLDWLKPEIDRLGVDRSKIALSDFPPKDFPDSPLARGAAFDASQTLALRELVSYYANTHQLLQKIVATNEDASTIRIWPHHFDIATLITLAGTKNGNPLTVGVGLSPGDTSYNQPYWYVSPYPYPNTTSLPPLAGDGFWHTQDWVGAVLTADRLTEKNPQHQVESFLDSAVKTSIVLLNPPSSMH